MLGRRKKRLAQFMGTWERYLKLAAAFRTHLKTVDVFLIYVMHPRHFGSYTMSSSSSSSMAAIDVRAKIRQIILWEHLMTGIRNVWIIFTKNGKSEIGRNGDCVMAVCVCENDARNGVQSTAGTNMCTWYTRVYSAGYSRGPVWYECKTKTKEFWIFFFRPLWLIISW